MSCLLRCLRCAIAHQTSLCLSSTSSIASEKKAGKKFRTIDRRTLKRLQAYGWPGNVRELQNVIERAVILSEGDIFSVDEGRRPLKIWRWLLFGFGHPPTLPYQTLDTAWAEPPAQRA